MTPRAFDMRALLMPVMNQLGISPIHFASIMGVNLAMGGVTPHTQVSFIWE